MDLVIDGVLFVRGSTGESVFLLHTVYLQVMHFLAAHLNEPNVEWGGVGLGTLIWNWRLLEGFGSMECYNGRFREYLFESRGRMQQVKMFADDGV